MSLRCRADIALAARKSIRPQDIAGEVYITPTKAAPALKAVIDGYAARSGITLTPAYEAENLSMAMRTSVASTGRRHLAAAIRREPAAAGGCHAAVAGRDSDHRSGSWAIARRTRRPCSSASWRKPMKWPPTVRKNSRR